MSLLYRGIVGFVKGAYGVAKRTQEGVQKVHGTAEDVYFTVKNRDLWKKIDRLEAAADSLDELVEIVGRLNEVLPGLANQLRYDLEQIKERKN